MCGLEVDSKWLLKFPGSWVTMILILLIFIVKYTFGYALSSDPNLVQNTRFEFWMLATCHNHRCLYWKGSITLFIKKGPCRLSGNLILFLDCERGDVSRVFLA